MSFSTIHPPGSVLDYSIDFASLLSEGEGLNAVTVTATGVTAVSTSISGTKAVAILSGGVDGGTARAVYRVTTDSTPSRVFVQTLALKITSPPVAVQNR